VRKRNPVFFLNGVEVSMCGSNHALPWMPIDWTLMCVKGGQRGRHGHSIKSTFKFIKIQIL
jgi:hypothetical protein